MRVGAKVCPHWWTQSLVKGTSAGFLTLAKANSLPQPIVPLLAQCTQQEVYVCVLLCGHAQAVHVLVPWGQVAPTLLCLLVPHCVWLPRARSPLCVGVHVHLLVPQSNIAFVRVCAFVDPRELGCLILCVWLHSARLPVCWLHLAGCRHPCVCVCVHMRAPVLAAQS